MVSAPNGVWRTIAMAQIRSRASIAARRVTVGAVSLGVVLAGTAALPDAASAATPAVASGNVIVVMRNQHTNLGIAKGNRASARIQANHASQAPLITQARSGGASRIHGFGTTNAFSARVTNSEAAKLAANPNVAAVFPDLSIKAAPVAAAPTPSTSIAKPQPQNGPVCP